MRIAVTTTDGVLQFMRRAGYGYQRGEAASGFAGKEGGGEIAFVRRVGGGEFPRFHAYVTESENRQSAIGNRQLCINLHIDQKAPTYQQGRTHSGEYDGQLVAEEAQRLRLLTETQTDEPRGQRTEEPAQKRKGFFGRLFR